RGSVFAGAWKVMVPEEQQAEARTTLERMEREMAEEADAQAASFEAEGAPRTASPALPAGRPRKVTWALALAFLLPVPVVCFYARAWRRGAVWVGLVVATAAMLLAGIFGLQLVRIAPENPLTY